MKVIGWLMFSAYMLITTSLVLADIVVWRSQMPTLGQIGITLAIVAAAVALVGTGIVILSNMKEV